jgi:hypothetical protein
VRLSPEIKTLTDTGYQGINKLHANTDLPKKNPLTKEDKRKNQCHGLPGKNCGKNR